jgi:hydrogenase maturation protease
MVHVVCFGNAWQGDDGIGLHVHAALALRPHAGAVVFDAGIAGLSALGCFAGCGRAIVVDAMRGGGPVGTVHVLRADEVTFGFDASNLHGAGVGQVLAALPAYLAPAPLPELIVVGVEIGVVRSFTSELSPPVAWAVPHPAHVV